MANFTASKESPSHDLDQNNSLVAPTSIDHDSQARLFQLSEKVFGIDIILHKIIHDVVNEMQPTSTKIGFPDRPTISGIETRNLRLVNSRWLDTTNCYYQRMKEPLFLFHYFDNPHQHTEKDKVIKYLNFMDAIQDDTLESTITPFSLHIELTRDFCRHPLDHRLVQTFFSQKTSAPLFLVKLKICNTMGASTRDETDFFVKIPQNFKLPSLHELVIKKYALNVQGKFYIFVQSIVNATVVLRKLHLSIRQGPDIALHVHWNLPQNLIRLETTFTTFLNFLTSTSNNRLNLPHLKELSISESEDHPLANLAMEDWMGTNFRKMMPNVEKLLLQRFSQDRLRTIWCHSGWNNWSTINSLLLDLHAFAPPIPSEGMHAIHQAFDALVHLELEFFWDRDGTLNQQYTTATRSGLAFLFRKMTQLRSLKINIYHLIYTEVHEWDSVLLGTTTERAYELRKNTELWNDFIKKEEEKDNCIGIMNLRQLNSVSLCCTSRYWGNNAPPPQPGIISSLVFELGFKQLPHLEHLTLKGAFSIGMESQLKEWKDFKRGRTACFNQNYWG